jgi:F-type H+-transporting ATPase subunit b
MQKTFWIAVGLLVPIWVFGGEHSEAAAQYLAVAGRSTDFVPRIFNFLIFFGLAWYLVASPLKSFFANRRQGIADQLNEIEAKLQAAKQARTEAEEAVESAKAKAKEIASDAAREITLLKEKATAQTARELTLIDKQFEEKQELEERRMVRETIDEVLNGNITADEIPMSAEQVIDLVAKKVA